MTVKDLIDQLLKECEGKNPSEVEVVLRQYNHGSDWPDESVPVVDSYGGNTFPKVIVIK
jgi:hypothetical protein